MTVFDLLMAKYGSGKHYMSLAYNVYQTQTRPRPDQTQKKLVRLRLVQVLYGST